MSSFFSFFFVSAHRRTFQCHGKRLLNGCSGSVVVNKYTSWGLDSAVEFVVAAVVSVVVIEEECIFV